MNKQEIWKPVVGYESKYSVSNFGNVMRVGKDRGARVGHILSLTDGGKKGQYSRVCFGRLGKVYYVHVLVANAFIGIKPSDKHEINHKNGDTKDNRPCNLEWVTRSENMFHAYKYLGRKAFPSRGEKQWNSKLKRSDIVKIRDLYNNGILNQREIGNVYDIHQGTVSSIVLRKSWKHIP